MVRLVDSGNNLQVDSLTDMDVTAKNTKDNSKNMVELWQLGIIYN